MKRKLILWFMETKFYRKLITKIIPFIRFSFYYTKFRGDLYHEGYLKLQAGMMIGTIDYSKLTGILIPKVSGGILSHAALCIDKRNPDPQNFQLSDLRSLSQFTKQGSGQEIIEMTHLDFTFSDFFDLCKESERVIIFDCVDWDLDYKQKVIAATKTLHNAVYDVEFELGVSSLYCSELIYMADKIAAYKTLRPDHSVDLDLYEHIKPRLKASTEDLMKLGRPYISPDGLLTAKNVKVIWDSKGELTGKTGNEVSEIVFGGRK